VTKERITECLRDPDNQQGFGALMFCNGATCALGLILREYAKDANVSLGDSHTNQYLLLDEAMTFYGMEPQLKLTICMLNDQYRTPFAMIADFLDGKITLKQAQGSGFPRYHR
jgi:hypothetical protein